MKPTILAALVATTLAAEFQLQNKCTYEVTHKVDGPSPAPLDTLQPGEIHRIVLTGPGNAVKFATAENPAATIQFDYSESDHAYYDISDTVGAAPFSLQAAPSPAECEIVSCPAVSGAGGSVCGGVRTCQLGTVYAVTTCGSFDGGFRGEGQGERFGKVVGEKRDHVSHFEEGEEGIEMDMQKRARKGTSMRQGELQRGRWGAQMEKRTHASKGEKRSAMHANKMHDMDEEAPHKDTQKRTHANKHGRVGEANRDAGSH